MKSSGKFDLADFLFSPAIVLYYFLYNVYVGSGRSEADAKIWTPAGIALLYYWVAILLIKPTGLLWSSLCTLIALNQCMRGDEFGFLFGICLILLIAAFLRRKHGSMLERMAGMPTPTQGWVVVMGVLFFSPLITVTVGLGKEHAWIAAAIDLAWYFAWSAFFFLRFRRSCLSR